MFAMAIRVCCGMGLGFSSTATCPVTYTTSPWRTACRNGKWPCPRALNEPFSRSAYCLVTGPTPLASPSPLTYVLSQSRIVASDAEPCQGATRCRTHPDASCGSTSPSSTRAPCVRRTSRGRPPSATIGLSRDPRCAGRIRLDHRRHSPPPGADGEGRHQ